MAPLGGLLWLSPLGETVTAGESSPQAVPVPPPSLWCPALLPGSQGPQGAGVPCLQLQLLHVAPEVAQQPQGPTATLSEARRGAHGQAGGGTGLQMLALSLYTREAKVSPGLDGSEGSHPHAPASSWLVSPGYQGQAMDTRGHCSTWLGTHLLSTSPGETRCTLHRTLLARVASGHELEVPKGL